MYNFNFSYPNGAPAAVLGAMMGLIFVLGIIAIISYIFQALAWYTVAKKRNIEYPWLAWIPVANFYTIGKVGDYFFAKKGNSYNFAVINLIVMAVGTSFSGISGGKGGFFGIVGNICIVAAVVLEYICIYKFLKGVNPQKAVLMLVLGIIFSIAMPFILFSQKDKDDADVYINTSASQPVEPANNNEVQ